MPTKYAAGAVPTEAVSYFKGKKLRPSFDYRDVWREEHAFSFTVAKVMQQDILIDIQDALGKALTDGTTFEQFKKDLSPLLQKKGWWGLREMRDPKTGELVDVQLGSPRRLRTIYDANLRTARAAGQWDKAQRTKSALPYFVYTLGPSLEHRKEHQKWAGIILPVDHVFWKTHFAPNGWGCKCRIRQITQREADRLLATGDYTTKAPPIKYKDWVNKRTGEIEQIPVGIDAGWNTNAGWLRQAQLDKDFLDKAKSEGNIQWATESILSPVRLDEYKIWASKMLKESRPGTQLRSISILGAAEIAHLSSQGKVLQEILTVVDGSLFNTGKAKRHQKAGNALSESQWQDLPEYLMSADIVLWEKSSKQFVYLISVGKDWIKAVIGVDFKSKGIKKSGLGERLNSLRTAFVITENAKKALENDPDYEKVSKK